MQIASSAFLPNQVIPIPHTCAGPNLSPPLQFDDVPANAKSLALIVKDLDAENGWIHWFVFNIPPTTIGAETGLIPAGGVEGLANGGTPGYEGPCTKYFSGTHHYSFRLLALDVVIDCSPQTTAGEFLQLAAGNVLAEAELIGTAQGTKKL